MARALVAFRAGWPLAVRCREANAVKRARVYSIGRGRVIFPAERGAIRSGLLAWFRANRRDLPWRRSRDPYRIWIAEVMLQQTRIATVLPYYERFLRRFPSVGVLARAPLKDVLTQWSGLGYYSRARCLRRAAAEIVASHGGKFPRNLDDALALPGVGNYTAAATLSIAYDAPLAALDGNVARVLARLRGIRGDLRVPLRWRQLQSLAQQLLVPDAAGDWNQALMELGETVCTPRTPACGDCPVASACWARRLGLAAVIPAPRGKPAPKRVSIAAAILCDPRGRTLLVRDPGAHDDVLFSRLWQFPAVEAGRDAKAELAEHLRERFGIANIVLQALPPARHGVTFRSVALLPFLARASKLPRVSRARILPLSRIGELPISSATRKLAAAAMAFCDAPLLDSQRVAPLARTDQAARC